MMKVSVVPYDPTWPLTFQTIRLSLLHILRSIPHIRIIHVGSTSIPKLAAKPLIDIDIIVPPSHIFQAFAALSTQGYTYNPENWFPDRASFRWNGHTHDQGASKPTEDGQPRRQVYLVLEGGVQLRKHLVLKRVLLGDEGLREEYGKVKLGLAGREGGWVDIGEYGTAKEGVIDKIYRRGEEIGETGEVGMEGGLDLLGGAQV